MLRSSLPLALLSLLCACQRAAPVSPGPPEVSAPSGGTDEALASGFLPLVPASSAASASTAAQASAPSASPPQSTSAVPPRSAEQARPLSAAPAKASSQDLDFRFRTDQKGPGPHASDFGLRMRGEMSPGLIQRVMRQNFGRFRMCYEGGLKSNPNLQGRVVFRITIGRDGSVARAIDGGSDLPDPSVVGCMLSRSTGLSFPAPTQGLVEFLYPMVFSPGG